MHRDAAATTKTTVLLDHAKAARGTRTSQTKEPLGVERTDVSLPLVAMMAALVLSATPVAAEPNPAFNRAVSGPVVGTTFVDFLTSGCGLVHQTVDGTYTTAKGETGSFHLDMCPTFGVDSGSVEVGSFTLRDPRGSTSPPGRGARDR